MTYPRSHTVTPGAHGLYHCTSRCVRRAWLCGEDALTGRSFAHRKAWVEARFLELAGLFAVDLWGYAVMSNHYHVVIEVLPGQAAAWSAEEVAERWLRLSKALDEDSHALRVAALVANPKRIKVLRARLCNLSWFMRYLNEPLARWANQEDGCTGRFWEGRFTSEHLLETRSIIAAMAYVDLNPVRAGVVDTPEAAEHTSLARRLHPSTAHCHALGSLARLGLTLPQYLDLVHWTARCGPHTPLPPELAWLGPNGADHWRRRLAALKAHRRVHGTAEALRQFAKACGQCWFKGVGSAPAH